MTTQAIYIEAAKRALARAYANDAHRHLSAIETDNNSAIAIYHKGDSYYTVTLAECSCKGSSVGKYLCFHQLCLADRVGMLDRFVPNVYGDPTDAGQITAGRSIRYVSTGTIAHIEAVNRATGEVKLTTSERVGRLAHFERALETGRVEFVA